MSTVAAVAAAAEMRQVALAEWIASGVKTCAECGQEKPFSAFYTAPSRRGGLDILCKECSNAANSERRRKREARMTPGQRATWLTARRLRAKTWPSRQRGPVQIAATASVAAAEGTAPSGKYATPGQARIAKATAVSAAAKKARLAERVAAARKRCPDGGGHWADMTEFSPGGNADGKTTYCRTHTMMRMQAYRKRGRRCAKCGDVQPESEFRSGRGSRGGAGQLLQNCARCRNRGAADRDMKELRKLNGSDPERARQLRSAMDRRDEQAMKIAEQRNAAIIRAARYRPVTIAVTECKLCGGTDDHDRSCPLRMVAV